MIQPSGRLLASILAVDTKSLKEGGSRDSAKVPFSIRVRAYSRGRQLTAVSAGVPQLFWHAVKAQESPFDFLKEDYHV